jgi:hypothetical protein
MTDKDQVQLLRNSLKWCAKNLEEIAIPQAEKVGKVTSMDGALGRARLVLSVTKVTK